MCRSPPPWDVSYWPLCGRRDAAAYSPLYATRYLDTIGWLIYNNLVINQPFD